MSQLLLFIYYLPSLFRFLFIFFNMKQNIFRRIALYYTKVYVNCIISIQNVTFPHPSYIFTSMQKILYINTYYIIFKQIVFLCYKIFIFVLCCTYYPLKKYIYKIYPGFYILPLLYLDILIYKTRNIYISGFISHQREKIILIMENLTKGLICYYIINIMVKLCIHL